MNKYSHYDLIPPGSKILFLGDGQLGLMGVRAGKRLGFQMGVAGEVLNTLAKSEAHWSTTGSFKNEQDRLFADIAAWDPNVITVEFENVPITLLEKLEAAEFLVRPRSRIIAIAQSRWKEKKVFKNATPTILIKSTNDFPKYLSGQFRLKTDGLGYDGKGQWPVESISDLSRAFEQAGQVPCVLEEEIDFQLEASCAVARTAHNAIEVFPVMENKHRSSILRESCYPPIGIIKNGQIAKKIWSIASRAAIDLGLVGMMTLEFFVLKTGHVIVNEMAPRIHNSYHGTLDFCMTSHAEQHIRAICNLPLGDTTMLGTYIMINLLGEDASSENVVRVLEKNPSAKIYLYGKEIRPGRKCGHYTYPM